MKHGDYGYFGKGLTGYAHYRTAFRRAHRRQSGGPAEPPPAARPARAGKPPEEKEPEKRTPEKGGPGCLSEFLLLLGLVAVLLVLLTLNQAVSRL